MRNADRSGLAASTVLPISKMRISAWDASPKEVGGIRRGRACAANERLEALPAGTAVQATSISPIGIRIARLVKMGAGQGATVKNGVSRIVP